MENIITFFSQGGTMEMVYVIILSIILGVQIIESVPAVLHTPLMSVTNAISGIIIIGSLTLILLDNELKGLPSFQNNISSYMGYFATILASINVFGGFVVTQRMLAMYKKKKQKS